VIMFRPFLVAVILLLLGGSAFAQQVDVAASVPVRSPTGSGVRNLTFGEVTPLAGTTQTIDVPAAAAPQSATIQSGEFRYDLTATRGISFNVTMPTQLTAPGADPLVMTANGSQYGAYCVSNTAACSLTSFNPSAGQTITVCRTMIFGFCLPLLPYPNGTNIRVFVGGRITVPATARAGIYTGTATLTIVQVY